MSIKENLLSKMPENLSDLEKARYLYIELGKLVSYSTKFQNTDDKNFLAMTFKEINVDKFDKNQVNCIMWSSLYSNLLTSVGIENQVIDRYHRYVEFYIDDKCYVADATEGPYTDLARIHNDDDTCHFGLSLNKDKQLNSIKHDKDSLDLIKSIDEKLGYNTDLKENIMELKELLEKIKNNTFNIYDIANAEVDDRLTFKMEYLFSKLGALKAGYYESKDYVYNLECDMLTEEEMKNVKGVELKRTNNNYEVDIVQCIYICENNKINYYLLTPFQPIRKVCEEELCALATLGYGIEDKIIPGINFPKKFVRGVISNKRSYKLYKNPQFINLEIYNEEQCKKI